MYTLSLLGPPILSIEGNTVPLIRRKSVALLAYLAMNRHPHGRDELAALFWPDHGQSRARANLRRCLFSITEALGKGALAGEQDTVSLNPDVVATDVQKFLSLSIGCETHERDRTCDACLPLLEEAVSVYQNDFLTGFSLPDCSLFDEWQLAEGERLRRELDFVFGRLVRAYEERAHWDSALQYARRLLSLDPLEERSHRTLMRVLALAGRRAAAMRQYDECVRIIESEFGGEPEAETTELYTLIRDGKIGTSDQVVGGVDAPTGTADAPLPVGLRGPERETTRDVTAFCFVRAEHGMPAMRRVLEEIGGRSVGGWSGCLAVFFPSAAAAAAAAVCLLDRSALPDAAEIAAIGRPTIAIHADSECGGESSGANEYRTFALASAGLAGDFLLSSSAWRELGESFPMDYPVEPMGTHILPDLGPPSAVYRVRYPGMSDSAPSLRTMESVPNNLPIPATNLAGRINEIKEILRLFRRDGVRILTITGPAGIGKTRLSLHVAAAVASAFDDGIFFVDLASLRFPTDVPGAVLSALSLLGSAHQRRPPAELVTDYLRRRRMLLIFDNFEHLLPAASFVSSLVRECPMVKVLATSRAKLALAGEYEYSLSPLGLAGPDAATSDIARSDAVRLFMDRAAAQSAVAPITEDLPTYARICRRLDAMPLAIELAAPQLKFMNPAELLQRLNDRMDWLRSPLHDVPDRRQTLSAAIGWSYNLLEEEPRRFLRMLSVFVGGWTLEAAESIYLSAPTADSTRETRSADGTEPRQIDDAGNRHRTRSALRLLELLIDQSLVVAEKGAEETRYRLLETIREFANQRLRSKGELPAWKRRHAEYFASLAQHGESALQGPDAPAWLVRLEREYGNLQAAIAWYEQEGPPEESLQFVLSLQWFSFLRGHFTDSRSHLERALQRAHLSEDSFLLGRGLYALGWATFVEGDWTEACELYRRALAVCRKNGDRYGESIALSDLGVAERFSGNTSLGDKLAVEGVRVAREVGDSYRLATALVRAYATVGGRLIGETPQKELEEAAAITLEIGDLWGYAHARNGLGDLFRETGDFAAARREYEESLVRMRILNDRWMIAWNYEGLGRTAYLAGLPKEGVRYYLESLRLFHELGDHGNSLFIIERLAETMAAAGMSEEAARALSALRAEHVADARRAPVGSRSPLKSPADGQLVDDLLQMFSDAT